jgi:tRNA 5-methylaminomethyl-2-thiouridine biosynthesis bifunctional protein
MTAEHPLALKRPHAVLDWAQTGPVARDAGDIYFSAASGLEEARAVFLAGAGFPERFSDGLTVVGELGFGTGLNVLALWDSFRKHAPDTARLHVVSVEGFPLTHGDAARALAAFPELNSLAEALLAVWPSPHKGAHRRVFDDGRVTLTVFHDTVEAALAQMNFAADAWFLDGFSPAKNPHMWTPGVFDHLARLSKPGAPAATFTVAGAVRRGLAAAGFTVEKKPGFAHKRERLEAIYAGDAARPAPTPFAAHAPLSGTRPGADTVAIIGGGIAAASLAEALTRRGRRAEVFARGGWGAGASGAPLGLLTPRLEAADRPQARALLNAFDYAALLYARLGVFTACGVLRLAGAGAGAARLRRLAQLLDERFDWLDADAASARTGAASGPGLWMAPAGTFRPGAVIKALAGEIAAQDVSITGVDSGAEGSFVTGADGVRRGPYAAIILAGGHEAGALSGLPIEANAGRIAVFETASDLIAPLAWGGYAAPLSPGRLLVGATHIKGADPQSPEQGEAELRQLLSDGPVTLPEPPGVCVENWGGVRAALADRLPVVGLTPGEGFDAHWRDAARSGSPHGSQGLAAEPPVSGVRGGVLMLGALGARGFAHAPLLAEHLAGVLCGEPPALEQDGLDALHPARLAWRALKRGG